MPPIKDAIRLVIIIPFVNFVNKKTEMNSFFNRLIYKTECHNYILCKAIAAAVLRRYNIENTRIPRPDTKSTGKKN